MQRGPLAEWLRGVVPGPWRAQGPALYRLVLLVLAVVACVGSLQAVWAFTIDDAGISYAYAKHIAEGDGPVAAVGGPWIEGYSNPLWVFLLVLPHWLGLGIPGVAKLLGAGLFGLGLWFSVACAALAEGRRSRAWGATDIGLVIASALCLELVVWAPAGLENALFAALLMALLWLGVREDAEPERLPWSGLAAFALSITRPEGVLYAAPLVAVGFLRVKLRGAPLSRALRGPLFFALPLVVYHLGHALAFGQLLPNTYYAKPGSRDWGNGWVYLQQCARESGLVYAAPLALIGLWGPLGVTLRLAWACVAGVVFVVYSGGDWMPHARFLSLFAPAYLLLAALGLGQVSRVLAWAARGRVPRELFAFACTVPLLGVWLGYQEPRLAELSGKGWCHFCERSRDAERVQQLGVRARLPSATFVTQDFGGPSWLSSESFYPIDFLGLCDRSVALIRRERLRGSIGDDYRLYQYLIHEQPSAPSWVLVPPNFWPRFDLSPEYLSDYYSLSPRLLPAARRDSFFVLHRGELVDYFPPVPSADFRPVAERLGLVGFTLLSDPTAPEPKQTFVAGAPVLALVSVVPRLGLRGAEQVALRIEAGAEVVETKLLRLDRNIEGVAKQLVSSEPLALEFSLVLPSGPGPYRVSLGVGLAESGNKNNRRPGRPPQFVELGTFQPGAPLAPLARTLPRFPSALPAARDAELLALGPAVTTVVERARLVGRSPDDAELAQRLVTLGQRLESAGEPAQAYLAYVWATRADRRAWEALADPLFRLRPASRGSQHATEVALLRRHYGSGKVDELARLIAFYLSEGRAYEADYFWHRWPAAAPESEAHTALQAAIAGAWGPGTGGTAELRPLLPAEPVPQIAVDPLGGAFDFESGDLTGWVGDTTSFWAGPAPAQRDLFAFRGEHGQRLLETREGTDRAQGELTSPEFALNGRLLSLLVGGGPEKRRVGVRLVVDGQVVLSASGNGSDNLLPVFWDITPFAGKLARLVVFDHSAKDHVAVDRVLLWR